jgi:5,10-methylenetetrahydromethanopterin reductase
MRIGIMLEQPTGPDALRTLTGELQRAADEGFRSAWLSHIFGLDALTALAVAGSRVPGIDLGTAVVPTYPRHPGALAQQARTTALAVGPGRLSLGIGLSHKIVIENMFGYDFARPARHMKEYLAVLGPLLADKPVSFTGETLSGNLALSVPNEDRVPVLLAALGPAMLKLAGRETDGTILWMTGPITVRDHIAPVVNAAAEAAGRPAPRLVCALPVCVTDDPARAREQAAATLAAYNQLPSYRAMMDHEGVGGPGDMAIIGTEEQVAEKIRAVAAAGATEFSGVLFAPEDAVRTRKLLAGLSD